MGVKKNYKKGVITIEAAYKSDVIKSSVSNIGNLLIEQEHDRIVVSSQNAAHLWPIIKLFAETERIFEDRYKVIWRDQQGEHIVYDIPACLDRLGFKTEAAAQLVCDAMNEAARMEEE